MVRPIRNGAKKMERTPKIRMPKIMRQYPNIAANSLRMNPKYAKSRIEDMIEELEWQKRQMR